MRILEILFKQIFTIHVGAIILYFYFKMRGENVSYSEIMNKKNKETGLSKYRYVSFYIGVFFWIILVIALKLCLD